VNKDYEGALSRSSSVSPITCSSPIGFISMLPCVTWGDGGHNVCPPSPSLQLTQ
jgi:hypothetical protein